MIASLSAEEIRAHPRFGTARSAHINAAVAFFKADRLTSRLMLDVGTIIFRGILVGMHFGFDRNDRSTWATPGNVRQAVVDRGLASPRRIDDLIAYFRQSGLMTSSPAPDDRRVSLLTPTDRLIAHDRGHLAAYHRFLLELAPGRGYEWIVDDDTRVHRAIRRVAIRNLQKATSVLQHPAMRLFLAHNAGYLALLLSLQGGLAGEVSPTWTSMAEDLGVSRSHLRDLFTKAELAGYVRLPTGRHRAVEILPTLWSAYDSFLAGIEADQDAIAQEAFVLPK